MSEDATPPRKRGCFFYGCIGLILFVGLAALGLYFGARYVLSTAGKWVTQYTETTPALLEKTEIPPAELAALQERVAGFGDALQRQTGTQHLILSAREINALIANDPNFKELKDKVFVMIDDDRIKGKISLPLHDIGPLKMNGRYLNGLASFKVSLARGQLNVTLDNVEVKGTALPAPLLSQLQQQNLAKDFRANPKTQATLEKFESIEITNGSVVLRNKSKE